MADASLHRIIVGSLPSAQLRFHPVNDLDPEVADLVWLEAEADTWDGDDLIDAIGPWLLASASMVEAIERAGLTGLRVGPVADLRYSPKGAIRARLGEYARRELPEFRIVRPERPVVIANRVPPEDGGIHTRRPLVHRGWTGDDIAYPVMASAERPDPMGGLVVTGRALAVLRTQRIASCQVIPVRPA
jgi:hypothetical protein